MLRYGNTRAAGADLKAPDLSQILPTKKSIGFRDSIVDLATLVNSSCAHRTLECCTISAVGWVVFPFPV